MIATSRTSLEEAALGRRPRDTTRPPNRMVPIAPLAQPNQAGQIQQEALGMPLRTLANRAAELPDPNNPYALRLRSAQTSPFTNTFANILASGGYRGSGKYSGFNTASDLESAILGATYELRDRYVPELRSRADEYFGQVEQAKTDAYRNAMNQVMQGVTGRIPAIPMGMTEVPEGSVYAQKINPLRQYKQQLEDWSVGEGAKPAEEYLQTAQQLEATPMSELARSIAINRYGMDPSLAAGKFATVGSDYFKKKRDEEYMQNYGMPYEEYMFEQDRLSDLMTGGSKEKTTQATNQVEQLTGLRITTLSELTAQNPVQLNETIAAGAMELPNPETGKIQVYNGPAVIADLRQAISSGDRDRMRLIYETSQATPNQEGMTLLIAALLKEYVGTPTRTMGALEELGLFD